MFVEITYPEIILMLFTVSMIWIFILTELHKIMGKLNAVSAGILFTIVVVTFLSNGLVIYNNLNETFGESFGMFSFGIVVILVAVSMVLSLDFITKSLDYIIHKRAKQTIKVKLSKESKLHLGGHLIFDVNFTNWFFNGYFVIHMKSPYWEEKSMYLRYDDGTKQGLLKGKYDDKDIQLRCTVPNDWGIGEYNITIRAEDVCKWRFSLKRVMNLSSKRLKVNIIESQL